MIPTPLRLFGPFLRALWGPGPTKPADHHGNAALQGAAEALAAGRPEIVQAFTIGNSLAGRPIGGLRLSATNPPPPAQPAILLVAGLDGARAYTSWLALEHARALAAGLGKDPAITKLLESTTVYIIPRLDVDACGARNQTPLAVVTGSGRGIDNDRDGPWQKKQGVIQLPLRSKSHVVC